MGLELESLKKHHEELFSSYAEVLKRSESLSFFVSRPIIDRAKSSIVQNSDTSLLIRASFLWLKVLTIRPLVTLFVESHIKHKADKIRDLYIQTALETESDELEQWLIDRTDALDRFSRTLSSWKSLRGTLNTIWPIIPGFLIEAFRKESLRIVLSTDSLYQTIDTATTILIFPAFYFVSFFVLSFDCKRSLFFFPSGVLGSSIPEDVYEEDDSTNIYSLENHLFDTLNVRKRSEFPFDLLVKNIAWPLLLSLLFLSPGLLTSPGRSAIIFTLLIILAILIAGIYYTFRSLRKREWK